MPTLSFCHCDWVLAVEPPNRPGNQRLDLARIAQIKTATGSLMTLHGASGTDDNDLRKAIAAGINVVHINTEVRVAWRHGLEQGLTGQPNEVVPYKILPSAIDAIKQVVTSRLKLFNDIQ
jgi:fructose-bisphosphate aldolase, class II